MVRLAGWDDFINNMFIFLFITILLYMIGLIYVIYKSLIYVHRDFIYIKDKIIKIDKKNIIRIILIIMLFIILMAYQKKYLKY